MSEHWDDKYPPGTVFRSYNTPGVFVGCPCSWCESHRSDVRSAFDDDVVKSPPHYLIDAVWPGRKPEVRHIIAWAVKGLIGEVAYQHASVLKYLLRATRKNKYWEDVQKAYEHLGFLLEARGETK